MGRRFWALGLFIAACAHPPPPKSAGPGTYDDPKKWLCLPGREDACAQNVDATELLPDGTRTVVRDTRAPNADKVDCFYVYPTVDLSLGPGNHQDFSDLAPMTRATVAQAAHFRSVCSLYVPLYRQITIGTYLRGPETKKPYTDVAISDVGDAFAHYLEHWNKGHKIVLMGHSQGGEMVTLLLQHLFDRDPTMRDKLLLAMPIGWPIEVPKGKTLGATFASLPLCTQPSETACVVAYRSHTAGTELAPKHAVAAPGNEIACVSPAELAHGTGHPFSRTFFLAGESARLVQVHDVTTPFAMLRDYYAGACTENAAGYRYLAISERPPPGDKRSRPLDLENRWLQGELGLHVLDYQFAQGDLIDLVAQRAAALP